MRLTIGSSAASVCRDNGKEIIGIYNDLQTVIDGGVSKRLILKQGPNVVRCTVIKNGGATDFCARFPDAVFQVQPKRGIVERTFACLGLDRRLSNDYEAKVNHSENFICLSMIKRTAARLTHHS